VRVAAGVNQDAAFKLTADSKEGLIFIFAYLGLGFLFWLIFRATGCRL